jgi:electron transfer flavoprotein alpha subunit
MSVLIFAENWDGKFKKLSFELVSYGVKVAEMLNTDAIVLSIGQVEGEELSRLGTYGAGKIYTVNPAATSFDAGIWSEIVESCVNEVKASVVILSNNNTGKAIAPRLSVSLKAGIGAGVSRLPESLEPFVVYRKVFSGNAFSKMAIKSAMKILTLAQNSFELIVNETSPQVIQFVPGSAGKTSGANVLDIQKQTGKVLLTDAEIVVSGGRGMKSSENWGPILELAGLLGAATACSRPVSDEGWRPHEEHTGQTGKIIAPNLYFAIGISGATQHLAGVSSSKYIVAINTDKDAPIFSAAQYGIVGDAAKVLPKLVAAVKEIKGK